MIEFHRALLRHKAASSGLGIVKPPRGPVASWAQLRARIRRNDRLKQNPKRQQPALTSWIDHSRAEVNEGNCRLRSGRSRRNYDWQKCMARSLESEMRNSSPAPSKYGRSGARDGSAPRLSYGRDRTRWF